MVVPLFGAAYAAPNKGTTILYIPQNTVELLNPPVNGEIQGLFKAFLVFSSSLQGKFYFQGLFKTVLYIQVFFKPVPTLLKLPKFPCVMYNKVSWEMLLNFPSFKAARISVC